MRSCRNKIVLVLLVIACLGLSAEDANERREEVCAKLKAHLMREFTAIDGTERASVSWIKQNLGADDEQIRKVMMDIYSEATLAYRSAPEKDSRPLSRMRLEGVIRELGGCADYQTKVFLVDYAASKENDSYNRSVAVFSYLRAADEEEAKDILLRFLVGKERMEPLDRMSLYSFASMVYEDASSKKKDAILASLIAAAGREESKIEFMKVDAILAERSAAYRCSRERLTMLERHSMEPPTANLYTDRDLKAALAESRNYKQYTSVSTNLAVLESRDSNLSQPGFLTNNVVGPDLKGSGAEPKTADTSVQSPSRYFLYGMLVLLLLGFGVWRFMRK